MICSCCIRSMQRIAWRISFIRAGSKPSTAGPSVLSDISNEGRRGVVSIERVFSSSFEELPGQVAEEFLEQSLGLRQAADFVVLHSGLVGDVGDRFVQAPELIDEAELQPPVGRCRRGRPRFRRSAS